MEDNHKIYYATELIKLLEEAIAKLNYFDMKNMVLHLDEMAYKVLSNYNNKLFKIKREYKTYRGLPIETFRDSYTDIYGISHYCAFLIEEKLLINYDDLVVFSKYINENIGKKIVNREVRKGSQSVIFYYDDGMINVFYYWMIRACVDELKSEGKLSGVKSIKEFIEEKEKEN